VVIEACPISDFNPAVSDQVERAIFQALSMHPNERPANVREMRMLLTGASSPISHRIRAQSLGVAPAPTPQSWGAILLRNGALIAAALTLLAIAILVSVF
jgi:hypothetical protein